MKEINNFKVLHKGDKVRKYHDGQCLGDYTVKYGGYANGLSLIYCIHVPSGVPEWIHTDNLTKLIG